VLAIFGDFNWILEQTASLCGLKEERKVKKKNINHGIFVWKNTARRCKTEALRNTFFSEDFLINVAANYYLYIISFPFFFPFSGKCIILCVSKNKQKTLISNLTNLL
jgi:hypothetical protein